MKSETNTTARNRKKGRGKGVNAAAKEKAVKQRPATETARVDIEILTLETPPPVACSTLAIRKGAPGSSKSVGTQWPTLAPYLIRWSPLAPIGLRSLVAGNPLAPSGPHWPRI